MLSFRRQVLRKPTANIPSLSALTEPEKESAGRALFFSSASLKGSMALEGSMVLPIFLFFIMTVLLSIETVRLQSNIQHALHQAGNFYASAAYQIKYEGAPRQDATKHIAAYMRGQPFSYLCVSGGEGGINIQDLSSADTNGIVHLKVDYGIKPFLFWLPIGDIHFEDEYFGHGWTGYFGNENADRNVEEDVCVYITKTGTKYHKSYDCTYLRISIRAIESRQVAEIRNASGGKYYACERCGPKGEGTVYVTSDGIKFHGRSDCSSLKRTVYMVSLSKAAQGYAPCVKCGG